MTKRATRPGERTKSMNEPKTPDEARDSRQPESEGRVVLQRLVRKTWETFDLRAATWAREEGELGSIVDVEIRALNTTWLAVAERLLSSPIDKGQRISARPQPSESPTSPARPSLCAAPGSATCPGCGQIVRICVPCGGDGSVDVYSRHRLAGGAPCEYSR